MMAGSHRETFTRRPLVRTGAAAYGGAIPGKPPVAPVIAKVGPLPRASASSGSPARDDAAEADTGHDLATRVGHSIAAVERAIDNVAAFRDTLQYYKTLADALTQQLDDGERERRELKRHLADAQRGVMAEQARAAEADRHAADLGATVRHLEDQIEALRSQTEHLVEAAMQLLSAEDARDGVEARPQRSVAA